MTFLSFEHLEAVAQLLIDVISRCVSGNKEAQEEGERWSNGWLLVQSEHIQHLLSPSPRMGATCAPQNN